MRRARETGLVSDRPRIIDATHLCLPQPPADTPPAQLPGSPDPDACFGRKSEKRSFYGYKEHLALDADSELISAVAVTAGNVADSQVFSPLIAPHARDVTADKAYDTNANHEKLKARGQHSSIIVKKNRTNTKILGQANPDSQRERSNIERKFAEQKKYHGLGKVWYWGLAKVTIQVLLTCIVVNAPPLKLRHASGCKKRLKLLSTGLCPSSVRLSWAAG